MARHRPALLEGLDLGDVLVAAAVWLLLTVVSLAIVLRAVLAMPEDHFERVPGRRTGWGPRRIGRNLAGLVLIAVGAIMAIPGVPGQGLLTMFVGVLLCDFPRRERLERFLVARPGVLFTMNRLRTRFGRAPIRPPRP